MKNRIGGGDDEGNTGLYSLLQKQGQSHTSDFESISDEQFSISTVETLFKKCIHTGHCCLSVVLCYLYPYP